MKIIKYEHACLIVEDGATKIIIDPGAFTDLPIDLSNINYVIITEEHHDHFNLDNLQKILNLNPKVQIFTTVNVHNILKESDIASHYIINDMKIMMGKNEVTFYETDHAVVYKKSPCKSLAVKISNSLYYPSDTYRTIDEKIAVLALPISGPWYKVSESIEFANKISSDTILATHDSLNSSIGNNINNNFISSNMDKKRKYIFLNTCESITI